MDVRRSRRPARRRGTTAGPGPEPRLTTHWLAGSMQRAEHHRTAGGPDTTRRVRTDPNAGVDAHRSEAHRPPPPRHDRRNRGARRSVWWCPSARVEKACSCCSRHSPAPPRTGVAATRQLAGPRDLAPTARDDGTAALARRSAPAALPRHRGPQRPLDEHPVAGRAPAAARLRGQQRPHLAVR